MSRAVPWYIKAVLYVAIPMAVLAALYMSFPGEVALAGTAGWTEHYAPAMPVCLSVYALAAGAISWYRRKMRLPGEKTALIGALMALMLAMSAQSIAHLIEQTYMAGSWQLTVAVSCIPPLVIGHLMHMAETPSEVKSASEELEETREMNRRLMTALVASESRQILSHTAGVLVQAERAVEAAEGLTEEAESLTGNLDEELVAAETKPRRKHLALTRERIEEARQAIASKSEPVTVDRICKFLGISQATYYRQIKTA